MVFNSILFLIFLPIVFLIYHIIPSRFRHIFLLLSSYVFYAFWNFKLIFLILFTTIVTYICALLLKKYNEKWKRNTILIVSLLACLGSLIFFKYANFMIFSFTSIINMLGGKLSFIELNIILPVGISFYTFQTLSYVIDVYKGKYIPETNIIYYSLYVSFFPQLVAGPIERPEKLLPQLKQTSKINVENIKIGLKYMLCGFIKKIVIADMLGVFVTRVFAEPSSSNGLLIVIGSFLFSIQIFCDFSGYSDIAVGCAKLFNVDLSENFNHPYKSTSIKDFWNRWHISLSSWLKDYIYIPLKGSRCSKARWMFNVLVVFFISGLWHGASWTFVIWGLMHGILQIIGKISLNFRNKIWSKLHVSSDSQVIRYTRMITTFVIVSFSWIAFRANSFSDLLTLYKNLFTSWNLNSQYFKNIVDVLDISALNVIIIITCILIFPFVDLIKKSYDEKKMVCYVLRKCAYLCAIFLIMGCFIYQQSSDIESSFIYFQF